MSPPTLAVTEADYRRRFAEPDFGLDLAEVVADRHQLPRPLVRKVEGSNLVFRAGEALWLKISAPFWAESLDAEVAVSEAVRGRLPASIPLIIESGTIEDWRYLVSTHVPGMQMQDILPSLGEADFEPIAAELGQFMRAFHSVVIPGFERPFGPWARYLDEQLAGARQLHLSRGVDPARVEQIMGMLAKREPELRALGPPVLIHADLTAEHIMLVEQAGRWRLSGVLDLADAMLAPAELDLVSPFVELFRGRRDPQRRLVKESGACVGDAPFSEALMVVALQHRFIHFDDWFAAEIKAGLGEIPDIARVAFPD
jgi:hygromycin-B 7''-O-kinase